jgi:hypothetical protein
MGYRFGKATVVSLSFAAKATLAAPTIASFVMSRDTNPAIAAPTIVEGDFNSAPVRIVANGWLSYISTVAQICMDGDQAADDEGCDSEGGTSYVDTTQKLPNGTHELVFKIRDANGDVYTARKSVAVN